MELERERALVVSEAPIPSTQAEWEAMHRVLHARVERAEEQLDRLGDQGQDDDDVEYERVDAEQERRKAALKAFEARTMRRRPELWIPGVALTAGGVASLYYCLMANMNDLDADGGGDLRAPWAAIAATVGMPAGAVLIGVGARKVWRGPEEASTVVGVGPGMLTVRGRF